MLPHLRGRFIAFLALVSAVTLLLAVTTSDTLLLLALILFGIAAYAFGPLMVLMLMDSPEVESRYMESAGGMYFCIGEIGGLPGH